MKRVFLQPWSTEPEPGYRPDGYSLHITPDQREDYVDAYLATLPDPLPDLFPVPFTVGRWVIISDDLNDKILATEFGLRVQQYEQADYEIEEDTQA